MCVGADVVFFKFSLSLSLLGKTQNDDKMLSVMIEMAGGA
jgi:hypothetical protein